MLTMLHQSPLEVLGNDRVKACVCSGQGSTCLMLPPMEGSVFFSVRGSIFPPIYPHPGLWTKSYVSRSCPAVGSLFLTIHCSSRIPTEQLSVHLPSRHTRDALMEIRVLRSQSKGEVDPGIELIFKSSSSRAWPIHLRARSFRISEESCAVVISIHCH